MPFVAGLAQVTENVVLSTGLVLAAARCNLFVLDDEMRGVRDPEAFEVELQTLWMAAQGGDEQAYRQALDRLAARLRAYLRRRMLRWPDEVEDLLQEILLAMHLQRATYDADHPVTAWMLAIARHKLVDFWRRRGKKDGWIEAYADIDEADLAEEAAESHAGRDIEELLKRLPESQRQAIEMTKLEGLSIAEAALQAGCSESAIKVQVHRGLKRLAELVRR